MTREALLQFAAATARVFDDRNSTVGASEIGQCIRRTFFSKNADDPVYGIASDVGFTESRGATLRGELIEKHFWAPALRACFGAKLLYAGEEQQTFASGFLSATPDGLLIDAPPDALSHLGVPAIGGDGSVVLECKSVDPRAQLGEAKPEHVYQALVQLGLLRELTKHQPQWAVISYINASFVDDIREFPVQFNPEIYATAKARAAHIMTAMRADELKPEGWIAGGKECAYCPFTKACGIERRTVAANGNDCADPQFIAEMRELAVAYKVRQAEVDAAEARLRASQYEIKERLRTKQLRRVVGGDFTVTWSAVKGRPGTNVKALNAAATAAGVDVAEFETVGDPGDRLTISIQAPASCGGLTSSKE
jgi:hypothetical protein